MSNKTVTFTDFESRLKNFAIEITATGPDSETATVTLEPEDLAEFYNMTPRQFHESYGENAKVLAEAFTAIKGLQMTNQ